MWILMPSKEKKAILNFPGVKLCQRDRKKMDLKLLLSDRGSTLLFHCWNQSEGSSGERGFDLLLEKQPGTDTGRLQ